MSRYIFHRTRNDVFSMPPGTWVPALLDGKRSAYMCCPDCGNVCGIHSHDVDADGNVNPSIVCAATSPNTGEGGCAEKGFHEWATLEGWGDVDWSAKRGH